MATCMHQRAGGRSTLTDTGPAKHLNIQSERWLYDDGPGRATFRPIQKPIEHEAQTRLAMSQGGGRTPFRDPIQSPDPRPRLDPI